MNYVDNIILLNKIVKGKHYQNINQNFREFKLCLRYTDCM